MNVAILGASDNPERYAYKAQKMLLTHGHTPFLVSPKYKEIEGIAVVASLRDITAPIDTLTLYVSPNISQATTNDILALKPRRVIFNPGAENNELAEQLRHAGILAQDACTLVLLSTAQF